MKEHQSIPAYPYYQYTDDEDIKIIFDATNEFLQEHLSAFYNLNFPIYTNFNGLWLDWVAKGIYGFIRPIYAIDSGTSGAGSAMDMTTIDDTSIESYHLGTESNYGTLTDDGFKRLIMWHTFKGDGDNFGILWLKRRIKRFIQADFFQFVGTTHDISITLPTRVTDSKGGADSAPFDAIATDSRVNLSNEIIDSNSTWTITILTTQETLNNAILFKCLLTGGFLAVPNFNKYEVIIA